MAALALLVLIRRAAFSGGRTSSSNSRDFRQMDQGREMATLLLIEPNSTM